jgi:hypothetical protein
MDWEYLKFAHSNGICYKLIERKTETTNEYKKHKEHVKSLGIPYKEYMLNEYFKNNESYVIIKNNFPYDLADGIEHYNLWIHPGNKNPLFHNMEYINELVSKHMTCEFICFMNDISLQSVPEITHYHIFIKNK